MAPAGIQHGAPNALRRGLHIKRLNALTAVLSGGVSGLALWALFPRSPEGIILGFLLGIFWANGFEYIYHRWILHMTGGSFTRGHLDHHRATGTPDEAEHVTFAESPLWIVAVFLINAVPVIVADRVFQVGIAPGMLPAFALYYVAFEEIHWRMHLGEWLPHFLEPARAFHLSHHDRPDGRFNVFLPLFDWLLGTSRMPVWAGQGHARSSS